MKPGNPDGCPVVIGAGIAGLTTARDLGIDPVLMARSA